MAELRGNHPGRRQRRDSFLRLGLWFVPNLMLMSEGIEDFALRNGGDNLPDGLESGGVFCLDYVI